MAKLDVYGLVNAFKLSVNKHAPEILTGVGIAGMITTTILAVKATPKALDMIDEKKYETDIGKHDVLPVMDLVRATWRCYVPAALTSMASIACLIGASTVNHRRNAALAAAYQLTEKAISEYKNAVIETIGEKKEQAIRDKVAENQMKDHPVSTSEVIVTGNGDTLCYDSISGRYFQSTIDKIKRAENEINAKLIADMYVALNDFYEELGLSPTSIGDDIGWNIYTDGKTVKLQFGSQLTDDGRACIVVNYLVEPKSNYYKL